MCNRLRFVALVLMLIFTVPESYAQKKSKRRPVPAQHANPIQQPPTPPEVNMSSTVPGHVPLPQERSLRPGIKKTKKVVIVPAPPPPPGRDPIPPYPKR